MFSFLRNLVSRRPRQGEESSSFDPRLFIYVIIPGDIQPLERGKRFEDPLQNVLQESGLGTISGSGSQMDHPYPDGRARVEYCGLDIEASDRDQARELLRQELSRLGVPFGTEIHYTGDTGALLDRCETDSWHLELKREMLHPKFGI
jgi:hypothetical protein